MKILLTHPGTQYAPALAAQLHRNGLLMKFATGIGFANDPGPVQRLLRRVKQVDKFARRRAINVPAGKLYHLAIPDLWSVMRLNLGHHNDDIFYQTNGWFQKMLPQKLLTAADLVIGFDTSSWILARRCQRAGIPFVLDISIGHPLFKEKVFEEIRQRYPAWDSETKPKNPRNIAIELEEMQLSNHFVAATAFSKKTYTDNGIPANKISVNAYGTNLQFFTPKTVTASPVTTFLFFSKISARKGFPWLCEVWERFHAKFPATRLIAAGYDKPPAGFVIPKGVEMTGFVHPADRLQLFHAADVFVFPSFFEGFAQVIIEAMACGLPVITTTHTVGPEVIDNFKEGFVIEPGKDEQLFDAMQFFVQNKDQLTPMGAAARKRVLPFTWEVYGDRWKTICENLMITDQRDKLSDLPAGRQVSDL